MFLHKSQSGKLTISGKSCSKIRLNRKREPKTVDVHFTHHIHHIVPCDPQHIDDLEWKILQEKDIFYLLITWQVSDVRQIEWFVHW